MNRNGDEGGKKKEDSLRESNNSGERMSQKREEKQFQSNDESSFKTPGSIS